MDIGEITGRVSENTKNNYHMIQQSNPWAYTLKDYTTNHRNMRTLMFVTALLMVVRNGNSLVVHHLMKG